MKFSEVRFRKYYRTLMKNLKEMQISRRKDKLEEIKTSILEHGWHVLFLLTFPTYSCFGSSLLDDDSADEDRPMGPFIPSSDAEGDIGIAGRELSSCDLSSDSESEEEG